MLKMISEDKLIVDCKKGNSIAQDVLYNQYASSMLGVCLRYCKNKAEAEDVLQEGFIKIFTSINKFEPQHTGSLSSWIKRIIVNTAINYLRERAKCNFVDIETVNQGIFIDENETEELNYRNLPFSQAEIMEMIQNLPDGYQIVFNLYVFEKYTHKEIAEVLKISESTSKTQLLKARTLLKKNLIEAKKKLLIAI